MKKTKTWEEITCPYCDGRFMIEIVEGDLVCPYCGKRIRKWTGKVWAPTEV